LPNSIGGGRFHPLSIWLKNFQKRKRDEK